MGLLFYFPPFIILILHIFLTRTGRGIKHLSNTTTCRALASSGDAEMHRNSHGDIRVYCGETIMRMTLHPHLPETVPVYTYCSSRVSSNQKDVVTLAIMDVMITFMCQIGQGHSTQIFGQMPVQMSLFLFFNFLFYTGVQPINNVVIISDAWQRDSAVRVHVSVLLQTLLTSRLPYNIDQSSLCYTVGSCWLSILNIAVCTCRSQIP